MSQASHWRTGEGCLRSGLLASSLLRSRAGLREEGLLVWEEFSGELVKETRGSLGRGTLTY